jgi:hypothetical protein
MTNLIATPGWDDVPQIETTTPLLGGPGGGLNGPAQALANRSELLSDRDDSISFDSFSPTADGVTDVAGLFETVRDWCKAENKKLIVEPGSYYLSRHVYFSERELAEIRRGANFVNKKLIVSGRRDLTHHYQNDLRPHADWVQSLTYGRVHFTFGFHLPSGMNNQGMTYWNGAYYVGFDVTGGNGQINRYYDNGDQDLGYGNVWVPTAHTAELAYRKADNRVYAASGGATSPTFVYRLSGTGNAVDMTLDFSAYGNSGLIAFDNDNDLLLLHTGPDDASAKTFRLIDLNDSNRVISQFTIPSQGTPQGLETFDSVIYYCCNGKVVLLDYAGNILDTWSFGGMVGECEGIALVQNYGEPCLAISFNSPPRVYTVRPAGSLANFKGVQTVGCWNRAVDNGNSGPGTSLVPSTFKCSIRKVGAGASPDYGWKVSTFGSGNHTFNDLLNTPTTSTTEVRFKFKRTFFQSIVNVMCSTGKGSPYIARADYDESTQEIVVQLLTSALAVVNPQTAADNLLWVSIDGGVRYDNY